MATTKKKTVKKTTKKTATPAVSGQVLDAVTPTSVGLISRPTCDVRDLGMEVGGGVRLEITPTQVVSIAVSKYERRCNAEIKAWQTKLRQLQDELKEAENKLTKKAEARAAEMVNARVGSLKQGYAEFGLPFKVETDVSLLEDKVVLSLAIYSSEHKNYYGSISRAHELKLSLDMTYEAMDLVDLNKQVTDKTAEVSRCAAEVNEWRRNANNVEVVQRQAEARMAERVLEQSETGKTILDSLEANVEDYFPESGRSFNTVYLTDGK